MVQVPHASVYLGELKAEIEKRAPDSLSGFIRTSVRMRFDIEDAANASGMDTDELPAGWWRDFLYDATREHLEKRREHERSEESEQQELEA